MTAPATLRAASRGSTRNSTGPGGAGAGAGDAGSSGWSGMAPGRSSTGPACHGVD